MKERDEAKTSHAESQKELVASHLHPKILEVGEGRRKGETKHRQRIINIFTSLQELLNCRSFKEVVEAMGKFNQN